MSWRLVLVAVAVVGGGGGVLEEDVVGDLVVEKE